ncbi:uncharacterized protein B0H18DRAFT_955035 [Fomitopsis serialis]|uniref:uncharacterized protein n=1 Tax=Fomitopsis serialis TaxID=139415 RepID=UPI0020082942|nr:uncharacterized protein B0H18DRAFT_955035 [Neoantrodia serialis]KAH9925505.1 hypothetical protein B0H18DRAFT_955035 [Neoantrodia serialis]
MLTIHEAEIMQIVVGKSDSAEAAINEPDNKDKYLKFIQKAFGDKYQDLPHVSGEIHAQKIASFTLDNWKVLQQWLVDHDTLNQFHKHKTSTMMGPTHMIAAERKSYTDSDTKKIVDLVKACSVGKKVYITQVNKPSKLQGLYDSKGKDSVLPKLVELGDGLVKNSEVPHTSSSGKVFPPFVALTCFNINKLIPIDSGTKTKLKWVLPGTHHYTDANLHISREQYPTMVGDQQWIDLGHSLVILYPILGASNVQAWREIYVLTVGDKPILDVYEGQVKNQVNDFLKKVKDGYKVKLSMRVDPTRQQGEDKQVEELKAYNELLLHPKDEDLCTEEDVCFESHISQFLKAIRLGARGTTTEHLVDNLLAQHQAGGGVQGGYHEPLPLFQEMDVVNEQWDDIAQLACKHKHLGTEDELEDACCNGPNIPCHEKTSHVVTPRLTVAIQPQELDVGDEFDLRLIKQITLKLLPLHENCSGCGVVMINDSLKMGMW